MLKDNEDGEVPDHSSQNQEDDDIALPISRIQVQNAPEATTVDINTNNNTRLANNSRNPPKKRKKKEDDDPILDRMTATLNVLTEKLNNAENVPEEQNSNRSFAEYIITKLNRITNDEIRDEVEAEIISVLNNGIKQCRVSLTQ